MKMEIRKNKNFFICSLAIFVGICISINTVKNQENGLNIPKEGYVPNEKTAIKIAEAVWLPIYGQRVYKELPFRAVLSEDKKTWYVESTFDKRGNIFAKGGRSYAEINKDDGKVLKVYHTK